MYYLSGIELNPLIMQEELTQVEALRQAKLSQSHCHPFFGSPLVLIGDPR
ncbi:hypothetical protein [Laspinema olomoucense]|uniref:Uncharacterized protein n=1 Tax=Laspinema olomoucense D3b TaxID=2953688 RepID=A0ABT2NEB8_9CYAN|nr:MULTISPECIES: hypothetical protein [unclassified Laspinema]MCT7981053.1 hypothetical protein [Laspinema sp. D3b]MCT7991623.1 hypothetical protein [Laspinema sp. D3a]